MKQPPIRAVRTVSVPPIEQLKLDNGIPLYSLNTGERDFIQLELIFEGGRWTEKHPLAQRMAFRMLREGTTKHSEFQIEEALDAHGITLKQPASFDVSMIRMSCLPVHFNTAMEVLASLLHEPSFNEEALSNLTHQKSAELDVDLQRVESVAFRTITEMVFGKNHPYGYNSSKKKYQNLTCEQLRSYHREAFQTGNMTFLVSGKYNDQVIKTVNQHFGSSVPQGKSELLPFKMEQAKDLTREITLNHSEAHQASIRMSWPTVNRRKADFPLVYLLNMIFGGSFHSRLNQNIREKKGYTYSIYSGLDSMKHDAAMLITTDVGIENLDRTIAEINRELDVLCNEKISDKELDLARRQVTGNMLFALDGPFSTAGIYRGLLIDELDHDYLKTSLEKITAATPDQLQTLAQTYFNPLQKHMVIVR